jgi:DNA-binding NarL/FixJ family response regulator
MDHNKDQPVVPFTATSAPGERWENHMTRVMVVDDHEVVRTGLRALLETDGDLHVVAEASSARGAVTRAKEVRPDAVVLDIRLPDESGVLACRDIRATNPDVKVLMLTSYSDDQALFDSIMAGASGFLLKQVRGPDLVDAVRRVAAGESLLDPSMTARVLERLRNPVSDVDPRLGRLTPTEERIVGLIAHGLTNREIGEQLHLAEKTIKNYVSTILDKLDVSRRAEAAVYWSEHRRHKEPA